MARIHATALVDPAARLADDVEIGAYSIIGPGVSINAGTVVGTHVVIDGLTSIGHDNRIAPHCTLGGPPQDKKYAGEPTRLEIGDRNTIRECCTFNTGTVQDGGVTRVGHDNWVMAYVHVAHDCVVGDNTIMANCTQLAGHVRIGDWAILGGFSAVHQFVQVGAHSMTGMHSALSQDLPPFVLSSGMPAEPHGINVEGLKRRGFSTEAIAALRQAYKLLYRSGQSLEEAKQAIARLSSENTEAALHLGVLSDFLEGSKRGIIR